MNTIQIEVREVYGNELYYPQTFQKELQVLTKTFTLTKNHIHALNAMGFKFEIKRPECELNGILK